MPRPRLESHSWWPKLLAEKDHKSLRELSETYNVSINGLSRALKRAGVQRTPVRGGKRVRTEAGPAPDPRSIEARSWWPDFLERKDKQSLSALAKRFGVAEITLQRAMKRTGVTRRSQRGAKGNRQAQRASRRLALHAELLGVVPDAQIAEKAGVSRYAVAQYRKRLEVTSVRATARPAPVAPKAAALATTRASGAGLEAYLVRVAGAPERFIVIAYDLAQAAATAQASVHVRFSGARNIEGLEYVGPAL